MSDNEYYSAGCDGYLMTVTARGLNPVHAIERTHRTIKNLKIENIQYRRDIVNDLDENYNQIKRWGWVS
jgi:phosphoribosylamine-glycine ligase